jgi:hypothetical protein
VLCLIKRSGGTESVNGKKLSGRSSVLSVILGKTSVKVVAITPEIYRQQSGMLPAIDDSVHFPSGI